VILLKEPYQVSTNDTSEGDENFQALPTFGVIPPFGAETPYSMDSLVLNFNPMMLLHGEQYLEINQYPIPTNATLVSYPKLVEVVDKGAAAVVISSTTTVNKATGQPVFYNETTAFLRGSGGFGGQNKGADRGAATAANAPPKRTPDVVVEERTGEDQAALYRLSGDYKYVSQRFAFANSTTDFYSPLHIDPAFAKMGGFKAPILHGLCFFGIAGKAVYNK
jgi:multifunctional beta-oxidation protein